MLVCKKVDKDSQLDMQPDATVRQRRLQGQSASTTDEFDTFARSDTSPTLSSSASGAQDIASEGWSVLGAGRQLFARITQPFRRATTAAPTIKWQREYDKIKYRKVEDSAPYVPRLAALQDSNESFCIFRRFGRAASRILLIKEIELDQILEKLDALDHDDSEKPEKKYRLKGIEHREGWDDEQQKLLLEMEEKLNIYYDLLLKYSDVRDLKPVKFRHHRSVHNYVVRNKPLYENEAAFLYDIDDFVAAKRSGGNETQDSRIEAWLESYIVGRPRSRLHNFLKNSPEGRKSVDKLVYGFSKERLAILAKVIVACLAMCTLFIPLFVMFLVDLSRGKMACVLAVFVLVFMVMMSVLVDLTPHDFFVVIAAYSAVLVALLSNLAQSSGSSSSPKS